MLCYVYTFVLSHSVCLVETMLFLVVMYGCEVGLWRKLSTEELMLLNCGVGEDSWESFGLQGDWVFFGSTDAEAETLVLWPPHVKSWLTGKDPDAGRHWGQVRRGRQDDMAGWHHQLDVHGFGWILGVGDGQGGLASCNSWGRKELDMTEVLNWTELKLKTKEDASDLKACKFQN